MLESSVTSVTSVTSVNCQCIFRSAHSWPLKISWDTIAAAAAAQQVLSALHRWAPVKICKAAPEKLKLTMDTMDTDQTAKFQTRERTLQRIQSLATCPWYRHLRKVPSFPEKMKRKSCRTAPNCNLEWTSAQGMALSMASRITAAWAS